MRDEERKSLQMDLDVLKRSIAVLERDRDRAREDLTRLAAWLKLRHPEIFKAYFLTST